ncbi:hypothetical protein [Paenibacillus mucilaginosus]|uniref:hypothetical protein n=1 Tax=Paenibacillus mucilaginosus TaxID=61624 RepID=UPI00240D5315|nr:hypothetical protein [Paenibacillus mucilaginosus]
MSGRIPAVDLQGQPASCPGEPAELGQQAAFARARRPLDMKTGDAGPGHMRLHLFQQRFEPKQFAASSDEERGGMRTLSGFP